MLPKIHRLVAEKDFATLFSRGRGFNARGIGLRVAPNRRGNARVGFVVSTKVSKRAVVRNLLKRRMRETVRKHLPALAGKSLDLAFIARPEAAKFSFAEVAASIVTLLEKAGLAPTAKR